MAHPRTSYDALESAENFTKPTDEYHFYYIDPEYFTIWSDTIDISISDEDFRQSMTQKTIRMGGDAIPGPIHLVEPKNPYVLQIARYLEDISEGWTDFDRAVLILNFVQTAIYYKSDILVYGMEDFWTTPTETLYMHCGDCEDQAALLCSLYGAFGYDWLMLSYPGHTTVGLNLDGSFYYCEPTYNSPITLQKYHPDYPDNPTIIDKNYKSIVIDYLMTMASYR